MKQNGRQLSTNRTVLREIVNSDIEHIYRGLSHPEVIKHYGVSFDSLEATGEQMRWFQEPEQCWWAICLQETGEFCGAVGLNNISLEHKKAEIGMWLLPEYWGNGLMGEVMPAVFNHGFNALELHRIEGFVDHANENCKRGLAKLDFAYEGTMRDSEWKDGEFVSVDIYAKLRS